MDRADHDLEDASADVEALVSGMIDVVADLPDNLAKLGELGAGLSGKILDRHTTLLGFVARATRGPRTVKRGLTRRKGGVARPPPAETRLCRRSARPNLVRRVLRCYLRRGFRGPAGSPGRWRRG